MDLLYTIQNMRTPLLDALFSAFTMLGEEYVVIILFCCLAWCGNKEFAHKTGFAFCLGMGVNQILKLVFCVQRPWILDERIKPKESALEKATGYSFPSGHTQSGVTAFGCLAVKIRKWILKILCVVFALMVGFSRMYLGVHTIYDVAVSLLIGAVVICITEAIYRLCVKHDVSTMLFGVAVSLFMVAFAIFKSYPPYHVPEYAFDCVKIAGAIGGFFVGWFAEKRLVNYVPSGKLSENILKVTAGVIALIALKVLFKVAFVQTHFIMYIQNFVLILWCVFMYPWILNRLVNIEK